MTQSTDKSKNQLTDEKRNQLTEEDKNQLIKLIQKKPLKIGLVGLSGVGKSSTINTMFKINLPISHTIACTKEFKEVPIKLKIKQGPALGKKVDLIICDAPGLGEDKEKDAEYIKMYKENLPDCDIILWVMAARNRAVTLDQSYLEQLLKDSSDLSERIVFAINQVDLVEPMNWNPKLPIPSKEQMTHIDEIVNDRTQRFSHILGRTDVKIIPYSSKRKYNLEVLFTELLESCAGNRSWIFGGLKNFSFEDAIPNELIEKILQGD
jgi:predicted GTPase